ncbi:MAG: hypothetical protein ACI9LO_000796 [Planctomycetota bacterium]|jgi:hypothetical protein
MRNQNLPLKQPVSNDRLKQSGKHKEQALVSSRGYTATTVCLICQGDEGAYLGKESQRKRAGPRINFVIGIAGSFADDTAPDRVNC